MSGNAALDIQHPLDSSDIAHSPVSFEPWSIPRDPSLLQGSPHLRRINDALRQVLLTTDSV
jgi:hypothetical protein